MKQKIWESKEYYDHASHGSSYIEHPGMQALKALVNKNNKVIDLGCGEGTRLSFLNPQIGFGVDISKIAINMAKKKYPKFKFSVENLEKLPFKSEEFDLAYSAFVLEHTTNPSQVLQEAVRILKRNGYLIIMAPNYGAPNRCSPPFKGSRYKKLLKGVKNDIRRVFVSSNELDWTKVKPKKGKYQPDWDTTVEPYIGSLVVFLKSLGVKTIETNTIWNEELKGAKMHQKIFKLLSSLGVYPFVYWGPQILFIGRKI